MWKLYWPKTWEHGSVTLCGLDSELEARSLKVWEVLFFLVSSCSSDNRLWQRSTHIFPLCFIERQLHKETNAGRCRGSCARMLGEGLSEARRPLWLLPVLSSPGPHLPGDALEWLLCFWRFLKSPVGNELWRLSYVVRLLFYPEQVGVAPLLLSAESKWLFLWSF